MIQAIITTATVVIAWVLVAQQSKRLAEAEEMAKSLRAVVKDYERRFGNVPVAPLEVVEILDVPRNWIPEYLEVEE